MSAQPLSSLQMISVQWWNASAYYAISLAEALQLQGQPVTAAGRHDSPAILKARAWNIPVFGNIDLQKPQRTIGDFTRLKRFLHENKPDIINAHRPEDMLFAALLRKFTPQYQIPFIRTVSDVRSPKKNLPNAWLHAKAAQHFIFTSRSSYDRYMSVWPVFEGRSSIIYSGIDTRQFKPRAPSAALRKRLGLSGGRPLFALIARLAEVKDHHSYLHAAATVVRTMPECRFLIAGEAIDYDIAALKSRAGELGIAENVVFLPREAELDVREIISLTDVGVVCSKGSEVICRVAMEFMAMKKPVIATDVNVLAEMIVDGENGFLIPREDSDALASAMLRLAGNPDLQRKLGEQARSDAESRFSYRVFANATLEVYRKVLQERPQS